MSSLSLNWRTHTTNETTLASGQKVKQKKLSYVRRKVCWFWWIPVSKPCRVGKPPHGSHPPAKTRSLGGPQNDIATQPLSAECVSTAKTWTAYHRKPILGKAAFTTKDLAWQRVRVRTRFEQLERREAVERFEPRQSLCPQRLGGDYFSRTMLNAGTGRAKPFR